MSTNIVHLFTLKISSDLLNDNNNHPVIQLFRFFFRNLLLFLFFVRLIYLFRCEAADVNKKIAYRFW